MSYLLKNNKIEVIIGAPTEMYNGSRFDLSGNIFQVTLNRKHTFCSTEKNEHNNQYGFGMVNEFDIDQPQSYKDASRGEKFHKIGVGDLQKTNEEDYHFFKPYPKSYLNYIVKQIGSDEIVFYTESSDIRGMKYEYSKTISIYENYLWIKYQLRNIGSVAFNTTEYCHNFLAVNNRPLDASYRLKIKQPIMPEHFSERVNTDGLLAFGKNEITLKTTPDSDFFIAQLNGDNQKCTGWQLENTEEKAAVSEVVDFEPMQMNLWGTTHVISPELFFNTILLPQEEAVWRRKFTFYEL